MLVEPYSYLTLCLVWCCSVAAKQEIQNTSHYKETDQNTDQL